MTWNTYWTFSISIPGKNAQMKMSKSLFKACIRIGILRLNPKFD